MSAPSGAGPTGPGPSFRIGQGLDVHRFSDRADRPLVLGGVTIHGDGVRGLEGWELVTLADGQAVFKRPTKPAPAAKPAPPTPKAAEQK